jgi:hypothetical protein
MKEEKLYDEGNDEVALKVMADTTGLTIEARGEDDGSVESFEIGWVQVIEAMIRVAGKL